MKTSTRLDTLGALTLNRVFGVKPIISHCLIKGTGSIGAIFRLSEKERNEILGPHSPYRDKLSDHEIAESEKELDWLSRFGARFISIEEDAYPALLKECPDAPIGLYYRSATSPESLFSQKMISIVGTRDASPYGLDWCRRIVSAISKAPTKPCIVSGLALGIDGHAHRSALETGLNTIGVLPTGIDTVYPHSHYRLSEELANRQGCALISDFNVGSITTRASFLRRNRIIAGLSGATILVESKRHGGGLITAGMALEYGRDVFALPGRIDDITSQGCNNLIEENKAEIISHTENLSYRLGLGHTLRSRRKSFPEKVEKCYCNLPADILEDLLLFSEALSRNRGADPEELSVKCGLTYSRTLQLATMMQKDGLIQMDLLQRCTIVTDFD